jgi:hypothetical protein
MYDALSYNILEVSRREDLIIGYLWSRGAEMKDCL